MAVKANKSGRAKVYNLQTKQWEECWAVDAAERLQQPTLYAEAEPAPEPEPKEQKPNGQEAAKAETQTGKKG